MITAYKAMQRLHHYYHIGDTHLALEWGRKTLAQKNIELELKLQMVDLMALCHRRLNSDKDVYFQLETSIKYLDRFATKPLSFSIYCNYVEALINLGFEQEAKKQLLHNPIRYLKRAKKDLTWAQTYLVIRRLQYLFAKKYKTIEKKWIILEAVCELSKFIGDKEVLDFAEQELKLYHFEEGQVVYFQKWIYLRQDGIALFPQEKRVSCLTENEAVKNAIELLVANPMQIHQFFKAVTHKTYNPKLHKRALSNILSKIKKTLSSDSLILYEKSIALA